MSARRASSTPESEVAGVVHRNIHALMEMRKRHEQGKSRQHRLADTVTRFAGSITAVYFHIAVVATWLFINTGMVHGLKPFDPFPFTLLAAIASIEAIFISTFVLISQNRTEELSERRSDLDLQINLLSEHEVTRLINMVDAMVRHFGVKTTGNHDVEELKKDVCPETVLNTIEEAETTK